MNTPQSTPEMGVVIGTINLICIQVFCHLSVLLTLQCSKAAGLGDSSS